MTNEVPKEPAKTEQTTCEPGRHDWKFFDSFPGFEIFECRVCRLRKSVNQNTRAETYE